MLFLNTVISISLNLISLCLSSFKDYKSFSKALSLTQSEFYLFTQNHEKYSLYHRHIDIHVYLYMLHDYYSNEFHTWYFLRFQKHSHHKKKMVSMSGRNVN